MPHQLVKVVLLLIAGFPSLYGSTNWTGNSATYSSGIGWGGISLPNGAPANNQNRSFVGDLSNPSLTFNSGSITLSNTANNPNTNTFNNVVNISGGTLTFNTTTSGTSAALVNNFQSDLNVFNTGALVLELASASQATMNNTVSGATSITGSARLSIFKKGTGNVVNQFTGSFTMAGQKFETTNTNATGTVNNIFGAIATFSSGTSTMKRTSGGVVRNTFNSSFIASGGTVDLEVNGNTANTNTFNGGISVSNRAVVKTGSNAAFTGTGFVNTFPTTVTINGGTLEAKGLATNASATLNNTFNGTLTISGRGTLNVLKAGGANNANTFSTVNLVDGTLNASIQSNSTGNLNNTFNQPVTFTSGAVTLTNQGAGVLTNTFSGPLNINGATVNSDTSGAGRIINTWASTVGITAGGRLNIGTTSSASQPRVNVFPAAVTIDGGTLDAEGVSTSALAAVTNTFNDRLSLANSGTANFSHASTGNKSNTFTGNFTMSGRRFYAQNKSTSGVLSNAFHGTTLISAGRTYLSSTNGKDGVNNIFKRDLPINPGSLLYLDNAGIGASTNTFESPLVISGEGTYARITGSSANTASLINTFQSTVQVNRKTLNVSAANGSNGTLTNIFQSTVTINSGNVNCYNQGNANNTNTFDAVNIGGGKLDARLLSLGQLVNDFQGPITIGTGTLNGSNNGSGTLTNNFRNTISIQNGKLWAPNESSGNTINTFYETVTLHDGTVTLSTRTSSGNINNTFHKFVTVHDGTFSLQGGGNSTGNVTNILHQALQILGGNVHSSSSSNGNTYNTFSGPISLSSGTFSSYLTANSTGNLTNNFNAALTFTSGTVNLYNQGAGILTHVFALPLTIDGANVKAENISTGSVINTWANTVSISNGGKFYIGNKNATTQPRGNTFPALVTVSGGILNAQNLATASSAIVNNTFGSGLTVDNGGKVYFSNAGDANNTNTFSGPVNFSGSTFNAALQSNSTGNLTNTFNGPVTFADGTVDLRNQGAGTMVNTFTEDVVINNATVRTQSTGAGTTSTTWAKTVSINGGGLYAGLWSNATESRTNTFNQALTITSGTINAHSFATATSATLVNHINVPLTLPVGASANFSNSGGASNVNNFRSVDVPGGTFSAYSNGTGSLTNNFSGNLTINNGGIVNLHSGETGTINTTLNQVDLSSGEFKFGGQGNQTDITTFNWSGGQVTAVYAGGSFGNTSVTNLNLTGTEDLTIKLNSDGSTTLLDTNLSQQRVLTYTNLTGDPSRIKVHNDNPFQEVVVGTNTLPNGIELNGNSLNIYVQDTGGNSDGDSVLDAVRQVNANVGNQVSIADRSTRDFMGFQKNPALEQGAFKKGSWQERFMTLAKSSNNINPIVFKKSNYRVWINPYYVQTKNQGVGRQAGFRQDVFGINFGFYQYFTKSQSSLNCSAGVGSSIIDANVTPRVNKVYSKTAMADLDYNYSLPLGISGNFGITHMAFFNQAQRLYRPSPDMPSYLAKSKYYSSNTSMLNDFSRVFKLPNQWSVMPNVGMDLGLSYRQGFKETNIDPQFARLHKSTQKLSKEVYTGLGVRKKWVTDSCEAKVTVSYEIGFKPGPQTSSEKVVNVNQTHAATFKTKGPGRISHYINTYGSVFSFNSKLKVNAGVMTIAQKKQISHVVGFKLEYRW